MDKTFENWRSVLVQKKSLRNNHIIYTSNCSNEIANQVSFFKDTNYAQ